jgi:hypothetical protein
MKARRHELRALAAWLVAAAVWVALVSPIRAEREGRLDQQSGIRRERLHSTRAAHETSILQSRIDAAFAGACRVENDPSSIRQRAIAASRGLALEQFSLTVNPGPPAGTQVEAIGPRADLLTLARRVGRPENGGFLRNVALRERDGTWSLSATSGVIAGDGRLAAGTRPCAAAAEPMPRPDATPVVAVPRSRPRPSPSATPIELVPTPEPEPPAPFVLVGLLRSEGRSRASIRVGSAVRVVSPGDVVEGWKCLSIDRDEGVVFEFQGGRRVVLRPPANPE